MKRKAPRVPKKTYHAPKLSVYGDLSEMTRTTGSKGTRDSLAKGAMKTG